MPEEPNAHRFDRILDQYGIADPVLSMTDELLVKDFEESMRFELGDFKPDCEQCFGRRINQRDIFTYTTRTYELAWDVTLAQDLLKNRPREIKKIERLITFDHKDAEIFGLGWQENRERFAGPHAPFTYEPDEVHIPHVPESALEVPPIFAPMVASWMMQRNLVLIDGTHRSTIRFRRGEHQIAAHVLNVDESAVCIYSAARLRRHTRTVYVRLASEGKADKELPLRIMARLKEKSDNF